MNLYILLLSFSFIACKVTEKKLVGEYSGNWNYKKLNINNDHSLLIDVEYKDSSSMLVIKQLTGKWKVSERVMRITVDEQMDKAFWECIGLKIKNRALVRPLFCEPTHRFIVFRKVKKRSK